MWWGIVLVIVLVGCSAEVLEPDEQRGVWLESVESRNDSERGYLLEVCSDDPLFQGAFIPFSVEVGSRSTIVEMADFEQVSDECIEIRYEIERGFQEDLLSRGLIVFELDPQGYLDMNVSSRIEYAPSRICVDSDGDNPFLSGFVSARIDGETIFMLDSCANETATEYVCEGDGRIGVFLYECRDGCSGGSCRCLNSETCVFDGSAVRI